MIVGPNAASSRERIVMNVTNCDSCTPHRRAGDDGLQGFVVGVEKLVNYFDEILIGSLTRRPDRVWFNATMMVLVYRVP
jgi:hypothetical protein